MAKHHIRAAIFDLDGAISPFPESAAAFVQELRRRDVKLGLVSPRSGASPGTASQGLGKRFDAVVCGRDGPAADWRAPLFAECAAALGVPAFHCIVFTAVADAVAAAAAAHMKVVGIGAAMAQAGAPEVVEAYAGIDVDFMLDSGRTARFPVEPWQVSETAVRPGRSRYWESVFALSNGLLGLRGAHEEEDAALQPHSYPGMFVNAVYGYQDYRHVVAFPGYPRRLHVMLNLADWRIINLSVDGERFSLASGTLEEYRRSLDMRQGVVRRTLVWRSPSGRRVRLESTRLVSMTRPHSAAIRYCVTPLERGGRISLESKVRASVASEELGPDQTLVDVHRFEAETLLLRLKTATADSAVGVAVRHRLSGGTGSPLAAWRPAEGDVFSATYVVEAKPGETITLDKHAAFCSTVETPAEQLLDAARGEVDAAHAAGFAALQSEQEAFWQNHWRTGDVAVDGCDSDQQALRFSLFHLRQACVQDERRSIGANGMTGDKYRGHVFWDTEMYLAPYFLYTQPALVRSLLMYRRNLLDAARERAAQMAGKGALYSWNSISGEECGVVYEAATAEYHLLCAIAWAVRRYVEATGDTALLFEQGAEVLFETSRFLADRGCFVPARGNRFCINVVCGPDEYGCGVNNNCYTNVMVQWHLRYAAAVHRRMQREAPGALKALCGRIGLQPGEVAGWLKAADAMYVPFHKGLGIHMQDDSFVYLDPVDMRRIAHNTDIREDMHPLNLWRIQVAKQADVVLLMFVQGHLFSAAQKRRNYAYYEPRTNHGSSLSACIHSIVAAEVGRHDDAYDYFRQSSMMDLSDFKNNTGGGVHAACLGGTWMAVVNGFAGMRDYPQGLLFSPLLPPAWSGYRFSVLYKGSRIAVEVLRSGAVFTLAEGPAVSLSVDGARVRLSAQRPSAARPLRPWSAAKRPPLRRSPRRPSASSTRAAS